MISVCRKCSYFTEMEKIGVMLCDKIGEVVSPNCRSDVYEEQRVPKCCPYMAEHFMEDVYDEEKN